MKYIATAISKFGSLSKLNLDFGQNGISFEGANNIATAIKNLGNITHLSLNFL